VIRLVASDLDGTLFRSDGTVDDRTRDAIADAESRGIVMVLVTARPARSVRHLRELVGAHGTVLCSNGAVVLDLHSDRVVRFDPIPEETTRRAVAALRRAIPGVSFCVELVDGYAREEDYRSSATAPYGSPVGPIDDQLARDVVKLMAYDPSRDSDAMVAAARGVLGDEVTITNSGPISKAEISAPGVSKASALRRFTHDLGIDASEVIAVGDNLNDLPMLEWAGTSYAVANARPEVLARVDRVTGSNDEDGVAEILEALR